MLMKEGLIWSLEAAFIRFATLQEARHRRRSRLEAIKSKLSFRVHRHCISLVIEVWYEFCQRGIHNGLYTYDVTRPELLT
jgi:hypothetical protein